jgi:hypothetical protein
MSETKQPESEFKPLPLDRAGLSALPEATTVTMPLSDFAAIAAAAISVHPDGKVYARVNDRWLPVDFQSQSKPITPNNLREMNNE